MKSLILYYSRTGNTANVAEVLSKSIKSDVEAIKDRKDRSGILGYLSSGKDVLFGKEADIEGISSNIKEYGTIFLGTPVWVLKPSTPVTTMIKRLDLRDKNIVLFATCGGSPGKTLDFMSDLVTKNGGKVLHSFLVKTGKMDATGIAQAAGEEIAKLKEIISKKKEELPQVEEEQKPVEQKVEETIISEEETEEVPSE